MVTEVVVGQLFIENVIKQASFNEAIALSSHTAALVCVHVWQRDFALSRSCVKGKASATCLSGLRRWVETWRHGSNWRSERRVG